MNDKGHTQSARTSANRSGNADINAFVLEKNIFSNIFERDIKRVFIYKKSERLAKAIHLITPAFRENPSLRNRLDEIAVRLIDAAVLSPISARNVFSHELLALSSMLSIAQTGGLLSTMNAELINHEAHMLLQEVATYEEPRLFLDDMPSLAEFAKAAQNTASPVVSTHAPTHTANMQTRTANATRFNKGQRTSKGHKGQVKDKATVSTRRDAVLAVVRSKGSVYIKDVSTVIRNVSEKTIQRELVALVGEGILTRTGERRWTSYSLAS